jgi:hypothetical protein
MKSQCLSEQDVALFYKLYWSLLFYANLKIDKFRDIAQPTDFRKKKPEEIKRLRDILFNRIELISSFVKENPFKFTSEELAIIESWKKPVRDKFFIVKNYPEYTILMGGKPTRLYGVIGLMSSFSEMFPNEYLPIAVEAILLPFNDKIIYDSILETYNISFGRQFRKDIEQEYKEIEIKYGIITSLTTQVPEKKIDDEELLRFYMKTKENRERYADEAYELSQKNPELNALYHRELGRVASASLKRQLSKNGVKNGTYFGVLDDIIVASGTSQDDVEKTIKTILPAEKQNWVYIFRI